MLEGFYPPHQTHQQKDDGCYSTLGNPFLKIVNTMGPSRGVDNAMNNLRW